MSKKEETKEKKDKKDKLDLSIKVYADPRQGIHERELMKDHIIPGYGNLVVTGGTNSGKTQCVLNLLKNPLFMGKRNGKHYYDIIFLFSFSASQLLATHLADVIDERRIYNKPDPTVLQSIIDKQKKFIKEKGYEKAPHILIVLDDVINSPKFARSNAIAELFFQGTNCKMSSMFLTQNYMSICRSFRQNAHYNILFCNGMTDSEYERISNEHKVRGYKKEEFKELLSQVCNEPHTFLFINKKAEYKNRYRRNFDDILELVKFKG